MTFVRRRLRRGVALWLCCHVLALSALAARDCCAAHTMAAGSEGAPCHDEAPPPDDSCEHMMGEGAACPMHHAATEAPVDCAMTGVCGVPDAMLQAVLLQPAVPIAPFAFTPALQPSGRVATAPDAPRSLAVPPDAPPPRA
ncbi:MAG: hypothetical protein R2745_00525 [Vicinamibacterales bacterium]